MSGLGKEKLEEMLDFVTKQFESAASGASGTHYTFDHIEKCKVRAVAAAQAAGTLTIALQNYKEPKPDFKLSSPLEKRQP